MLTGGNKVYSEVEGMQLLLQYQVCATSHALRYHTVFSPSCASLSVFSGLSRPEASTIM